MREGAIYRLRFSGDQMKGRRPQGGPLPEILTRPIETYLQTYRPCLLGDEHSTEKALWISNTGRPIDPDGFSGQFGKVTEAAFGRHLRMHGFRHAAGSSVAKEDPKHVGYVPTILGHAHFSTSEKYYIVAEEHAAFQRFHAALDKLSSGDLT